MAAIRHCHGQLLLALPSHLLSVKRFDERHGYKSARTSCTRVASCLPGLVLVVASAAVSGRGQARGGALVTRSARSWCGVGGSGTVVACTLLLLLLSGFLL
jgi:hypothetical protein